MDRYLKEDLEHIAESALVTEHLEELKGASFLITGATGLVGSQLVKLLVCMNRKRELGISVHALVRSMERARAALGSALEEDCVILHRGDITSREDMEELRRSLDGKQDKLYVIHAASVTASRTMVEKPADTIRTSLAGTMALLDISAALSASCFVYLSSMEMYGDLPEKESGRATEEKVGTLDPLAVRSNYPEGKRMCENMCVAWSVQYGLNTVICRLAQTFGAGILPWEKRVFAQFAESIVKGEDIVLHTRGLSEGNYCYTADALSGILTVLLKGEERQAYNIANEECHTTIGEMAEMAAREFGGGRVRVVYDIPETNLYGYAKDTHLTLDASKLRALGWKPEKSLYEAYERMLPGIRSRMENKEQQDQ